MSNIALGIDPIRESASESWRTPPPIGDRTELDVGQWRDFFASAAHALMGGAEECEDLLESYNIWLPTADIPTVRVGRNLYRDLDGIAGPYLLSGFMSLGGTSDVWSEYRGYGRGDPGSEVQNTGSVAQAYLSPATKQVFGVSRDTRISGVNCSTGSLQIQDPDSGTELSISADSGSDTAYLSETSTTLTPTRVQDAFQAPTHPNRVNLGSEPREIRRGWNCFQAELSSVSQTEEGVTPFVGLPIQMEIPFVQGIRRGTATFGPRQTGEALAEVAIPSRLKPFMLRISSAAEPPDHALSTVRLPGGWSVSVGHQGAGILTLTVLTTEQIIGSGAIAAAVAWGTEKFLERRAWASGGAVHFELGSEDPLTVLGAESVNVDNPSPVWISSGTLRISGDGPSPQINVGSGSGAGASTGTTHATLWGPTSETWAPGQPFTAVVHLSLSTDIGGIPEIGNSVWITKVQALDSTGRILGRGGHELAALGSGSAVYVYGTLPPETALGPVSIEVEYAVQRDSWSERSRMVETITVGVPARRELHWQAEVRRQARWWAASIWSDETRYVPILRPMAEFLADQDESLDLQAEVTYPSDEDPDPDPISILDQDTLELRPGWTRIRITNDLFFIPMQDRGPLNEVEAVQQYAAQVWTGPVTLYKDVARAPGLAEAVETRGPGAILAVIEGSVWSTEPLGSHGIRIVGWPDSGEESQEAEFYVMGTPYRRFANPWYQAEGAPPVIRNTPGPVFYLSGSEPLDPDSLSDYRSRVPDHTWGFRAGDLEELRYYSWSTQRTAARLVDSSDNLSLGVSLPRWGRWVANHEPAATSSWLPDYGSQSQLKYYWEDGVLWTNTMDFGRAMEVHVESVVTSGSYPTVTLRSPDPDRPWTSDQHLPQEGSVLVCMARDPWGEEDLAMSRGTLVATSQVRASNGEIAVRARYVGRQIPEQGGAVAVLPLDVEESSGLVSYFTAGGPSGAVNAAHEVTVASVGPRSLLLTWIPGDSEPVAEIPIIVR